MELQQDLIYSTSEGIRKMVQNLTDEQLEEFKVDVYVEIEGDV